MSFWFMVSLIKKRNDIADVAWGMGFVLLAWFTFFTVEQNGLKSILVNLLVTIWGVRLAWHIHLRNKGKAEDYRYLAWRKEWGKWFYIRSYFQVYILQGFFLYLIVLPVLIINKNYSDSINVLDILGILVWLLGFTYEVVGDWQLAKFIKNQENKGKILQTGLWKYTRHPNYFGEVTLWWGVWLLALSFPYGALTIIGPLTITFLITKVSGIPMLEKNMQKNPDFIAYKNKTSIFIPMPPKK
jgi:steroid 5-alpha reductase family enzyme